MGTAHIFRSTNVGNLSLELILKDIREKLDAIKEINLLHKGILHVVRAGVTPLPSVTMFYRV